MKKFYWGLLAICLFYGCMSNSGSVSRESPQRVRLPVPEPQRLPECPTTEAGEAVVKILCKEGRLSSEECECEYRN